MGFAVGALALAYAITFVVQQGRAEAYCFTRELPNLSGGSFHPFVGTRVSPWTLRAYCTHPGNGRSLLPQVVAVSALKLQDEDARVAERIIAEELARLDKERAERKATE